ncbi:MAG: PEBP family protein [Anaerolineae bacterium]
MKKQPIFFAMGSLLLVLLTACGGAGGTGSGTVAVSEVETDGAVNFKMDAWADNWFAAYIDEELLIEDSVSITTERSFNAESVTFNGDYPLNLNFILKDFKENDTGLEYIGANNQQMGDGGFIMQLTDTSSGEVVAVSSSDWACTVIHEAPLDKTCESESNPVAGSAPCGFNDLGEPDGWKAAGFDDSSWTATAAHSSAAVSPKDGYDEISWDSNAEIIWGPDLETDNTVLCRVTIQAP